MVDFSAFMLGCEKGVPQYLEAMFSDVPTIDHIEAFRRQYRVGSAVVPTYLRTIRSFSFDDRDGGVKKRRHALRLALNARDILRYGRFNPRLDPEVVDKLREVAIVEPAERIYELSCNIVWERDTI